MPKRDEDRNGPSSLWVASGRYMGLGLTWALSTLLFLGIGMWLDTKLGTTPWLLIVGAFVGASAGFYYLYQYIVLEARADEETEEDARS